MSTAHAGRRTQGYSLVEMLIVLGIGLIVSLAIFQTFVLFEAYRRTTTAGNDALTNGAAALQLLSQEIETAGYGIVTPGALGCTVNARKSGTAYVFPLIPVTITRLTDTDRITVLYSTKPAGSAVPVTTTAAHRTNVDRFQVVNTLGFAMNDFIVAHETGKPCALVQLTATGANQLTHASGANPYNHATNANFPSGSPDGYAVGATLFNLGAMRAVSFQIDANSRLTETNVGENVATPTPLIDAVVAMRAQYGLDTGTDNNVDVYVDPIAGGSIPNHASFNTTSAASIDAGWRRVLSIRLAVVVRSALYEKDEVSPASLTLWPASDPGAPTTSGLTFTVPDRHYRYKVFETIIPIRNVIWKS
jgi:type IV pilus assembly protein PilW